MRPWRFLADLPAAVVAISLLSVGCGEDERPPPAPDPRPPAADAQPPRRDADLPKQGVDAAPREGRDVAMDARPDGLAGTIADAARDASGTTGGDAGAPPAGARQNVVADATEGTGTARDSKSGNAVLETVTSPVRGGMAAVRSFLPSPADYRAELELRKIEYGAISWMGWSVRAERAGGGIIFGQLATYPEKEGRLTDRCGEVDGKLQSLYTGGNGHKLSFETRNGEVVIEYILRHKGALADVACEIYTLGTLDEARGRWVDFVLHAKWTGTPEGFLRLWMKVEGRPWTLKVDYKGATWWDDEGSGPYFKMGAYTGPKAAPALFPVEIFTDEYRQGNERARFSDVSPDGTSPPDPG